MVEIKIALEWEKKDGDCSPCFSCGDQIFGNMYEAVIVAMGKVHSIEKVLCEPCYMKINPEE